MHAAAEDLLPALWSLMSLHVLHRGPCQGYWAWTQARHPWQYLSTLANLLRRLSVSLGTLGGQAGGPRTALLHEGQAAMSV